MTGRMVRLIDRIFGTVLGLVAVFAIAVAVAKTVSEIDDWWQWAIIASVAMRFSWVSFRDSRAPEQHVRSRL